MKGKRIAGFVCSLVGLLAGLVGFLPVEADIGYAMIAGLPLAIVGLCLSASANKVEKHGLGTAGVVLGIIGIVINSLVFLCVVCLVAVALGSTAAA